MVENLGKKYLLSHQAQQESYVALRDVLSNGVRNLGRSLLRCKAAGSSLSEEFWALKELCFEVQQGDRIGIIGRNGAGKSTLLKVLSRITEPSAGTVRIRGRVASLLEVGTGFHPELTGRENIYLNGAILGMGRAQIRRRFDEIVAFAEVEKFLDLPVKRYSSGMYVRLAFAVAAHLEPEILVVDEVLAVGDAQFQKKCLGKMEDVSKEGRTVLFVSHNMATISSLCQKAILLDAGRVVKTGAASEVILEYYSQGMASPAAFDYQVSGQPVGDGYARLLAGSVVGSDGDVCTEIDIRDTFLVKMRYQTLTAESCACAPNFHFFSPDGSCLFVSGPREMVRHAAGVYEATCQIPGNLLNDGTYFVGLALTTFPGTKVRFYERQALAFHVRDPIDGVPTRGGTDFAGTVPGAFRPLLEWKIRSLA